MSRHFLFLTNLLQQISLPLGIALILNSNPVTALPVKRVNPSNQNPPQDIIINTDPQTSSSPLPNPSSSPLPAPTAAIDSRFVCQLSQGQYTVMYRPESQPGKSYPWAIPGTMGDGWTAERRCNEISRRLEFYRPDGLLELQTAIENNYQTICVTTESDPSCRIVLTVPSGQDPELVRNSVFQNLTTADSGQMTQGVNAFKGGRQNNQILNQLGQLLNGGQRLNVSRGINLRPFLDTKDGGTGTQLNKKKSNPQRLNPGKFR